LISLASERLTLLELLLLYYYILLYYYKLKSNQTRNVLYMEKNALFTKSFKKSDSQLG